MIALTAINFQDYQRNWSFRYHSLDFSYGCEAYNLPPDQIYILPKDAPATGYLEVWAGGYIQDGIVHSGYKKILDHHYVTFQVPDYVYGIDLSYGHGISPLKPIPAVTSPLAKATAISWGIVLLIALGVIAFNARKGGKW